MARMLKFYPDKYKKGSTIVSSSVNQLERRWIRRECENLIRT